MGYVVREPGRPWTPGEDSAIRQVYAQHLKARLVPIEPLAELLGRTTNAIRIRASVLGVTDQSRPKELPLEDIPCPICGAAFKPIVTVAGQRVQTCGYKCGAKVAKQAGRPHPRGFLGGKHSEEALAKMSAASKQAWANKTPEQLAAHSERTRALASAMPRTENNHSRGKVGKRADLNDQFFRSRWEANYARWMNWLIEHGQKIASWQFEPKTFYFPVKRGTMSYTPDFLVTFTDGHTEWHEVKGWLTQQGATALKRFAKYYPDEVLVMIDAPVYKEIAKQAKPLCPGWE